MNVHSWVPPRGRGSSDGANSGVLAARSANELGGLYVSAPGLTAAHFTAATSPTSLVPPKQVPNAPTSLGAAVYYGDSTKLLVSYQPPTSDGGDAIKKYKIEYDTSATFNSPASSVEYKCPNYPVRHVVTVTLASTTGNTLTDDGRSYFKLRLQRGDSLLAA